jgi:hypothetical protein
MKQVDLILVHQLLELRQRGIGPGRCFSSEPFVRRFENEGVVNNPYGEHQQ